jgi:hypothetical protein
MKRLILFLGIVIGTVTTTNADVFIYKNKISYTLTGEGNTVKNAIGGWTIIDDSGNVSQVLAYTAQKRFAVAPMKSITFTSGDGGRGKEYTFFAQQDQWTEDAGLHIDTGGAKGLNSNLTVNGTTRSIPKTYNWSGRSLFKPNADVSGSFGETSGVLTFDAKETDTSNSQAEDINTAAQRLATSLTEKGYQEF